jgi:dTDP-glucose 4,6-dehydratase
MLQSERVDRRPNRILVTGGCGFIGSAFIRYLFQTAGFTGHVTNLDLLTYAGNPDNLEGGVEESRYHFIHGDIGDAALVARLCDEHQIDTVVHFAAESHVDRSIEGPAPFINTNIVGTFQLLEAARKRPGLHFHHVSTDEVYGSLGKTGYFTEETPYQPNSPYSASKAASDHLVRAYAHTYRVSATISNCSNNYGPYQFPEKLIPLMLFNMLERKPLPVYGDGSNVRDWLHVDDHAAALWTVVQHGQQGRTYNIGGNSERTNLQVIEQLALAVSEHTGSSVEELRSLVQFVADRPGHDQRYAIDCQRIKAELGWQPSHTFESGLGATVKWYLDHPNWVQRVRSAAYREWIAKNYEGREAQR